MRLIDADKFGVISLQGKSADFIEGVKFILEKIDEAPTVERPHGEWKEVFDFDGNHYKWECSVCGRLEEFEEDFCNCGADMRKGDAE